LFIRVPTSWKQLQAARASAAQLDPRVIRNTAGFGKSTTKEVTAHVLPTSTGSCQHRPFTMKLDAADSVGVNDEHETSSEMGKYVPEITATWRGSHSRTSASSPTWSRFTSSAPAALMLSRVESVNWSKHCPPRQKGWRF
jgi:hypothetical protein